MPGGSDDFTLFEADRQGSRDFHVLLWGSMQEVKGSTEGWRAPIIYRLTNTHFLSVFQMKPETMREYIAYINTRKRPRLIEAYAELIYVLARFAEVKSSKSYSPAQSLRPLPCYSLTCERLLKKSSAVRYITVMVWQGRRYWLPGAGGGRVVGFSLGKLP